MVNDPRIWLWLVACCVLVALVWIAARAWS